MMLFWQTKIIPWLFTDFYKLLWFSWPSTKIWKLPDFSLTLKNFYFSLNVASLIVPEVGSTSRSYKREWLLTIIVWMWHRLLKRALVPITQHLQRIRNVLQWRNSAKMCLWLVNRYMMTNDAIQIPVLGSVHVQHGVSRSFCSYLSLLPIAVFII